MSGAPITTKIASIKEAKTCSMLFLEVARVKALSTYILAGSGTFVPWLLRTPVLIEHGQEVPKRSCQGFFVFLDEVAAVGINNCQC